MGAGKPMRPVVAVLLSTYNGSAFLGAQLDSLEAQEDVTVRLHARDDGSTDETCAILRAHASVWPELAHLEPGPSLGPASSFLELLYTAPEDAGYYAFCDQDDVWLPGKLKRAVRALASAEGPALYCSNVKCVAKDLRVLGVPSLNNDARLEHLLFENIATGCTIVMNPAARRLINSRRPHADVVMHDWWCALVIAAFGRICYDSEPGVLYRQHGANSIGSAPSFWRQATLNFTRLLRRPRGFYRIHAQAREFLRLYGDVLAAERARPVQALVASRRSTRERLRYALAGKIERRRTLDGLAVRLLILADNY